MILVMPSDLLAKTVTSRTQSPNLPRDAVLDTTHSASQEKPPDPDSARRSSLAPRLPFILDPLLFSLDLEIGRTTALASRKKLRTNEMSAPSPV